MTMLNPNVKKSQLLAKPYIFLYYIGYPFIKVTYWKNYDNIHESVALQIKRSDKRTSKNEE